MRFSIVIILCLLMIMPASANHKTYLVHGYMSPKSWMNKVDKYLKKENFNTENYGYRSMTDDLDSLGKDLYQHIKNSDEDSISFVTHSMGALVVRSMLQYSAIDDSFPVITKIVMITPPNKGAEIANFFTRLKILKFIYGPNVPFMVTDSGSYVNKLPVPQGPETAVIIGARGKKHGYNLFIKGDNDGLLTPPKALLGNERDVIILHNDHITMPLKKDVCKLVVDFLNKGSFLSTDDLKIKILTLSLSS